MDSQGQTTSLQRLQNVEKVIFENVYERVLNVTEHCSLF